MSPSKKRAVRASGIPIVSAKNASASALVRPIRRAYMTDGAHPLRSGTVHQYKGLIPDQESVDKTGREGIAGTGSADKIGFKDTGTELIGIGIENRPGLAAGDDRRFGHGIKKNFSLFDRICFSADRLPSSLFGMNSPT